MAGRIPGPAQDVRPLALGVADQIAAAMDWSVQYTLGVLRPWKMAPFYCRAVLSHDQRITLDGAPAETVDAGAKELAAKGLAKKARCLPSQNPRPPIRSPRGRSSPGNPMIREALRIAINIARLLELLGKSEPE